MPATAAGGRRFLVAETVLVLGLSLGRSAVYSVLNIINRLTIPDRPLGEQTSTMNASVTPDRPWLDFAYQLANNTFPFFQPALALYRCGGSGRPRTPRGGRSAWTAAGSAVTSAGASASPR
ncbi:MAG: hypothetical protein WBL05_02165 [Brooklawnia sp.]|uniref:hypothetical protein n=1 Tax=Brooklawnia sp. TaxID=2699740 RepID=UPI003C729C40